MNDAVLAASAEGLRRLLDARGDELPAAGLRAMVPVNVRSTAEHVSMGNQVSSLFVPLPVAEPDPRRRHDEIVRGPAPRSAGPRRPAASS